MRIFPLALAASFAFASAARAAPTSDTAFLDFPYVENVSAAKVPAFAWLAKQADRSMLLFARAPDFRRVLLASRSDDDGQPITDIQLAPDGRHVVFTTGQPRGDSTFNPASLVEAPAATLWLQPTLAGSKAVKLGAGSARGFTPDGRTFVFEQNGDLMAVGTAAPSAKPKLFAKAAGGWSQFVWTRTGDLILVDNRRGYSFLGRYHRGAKEVDWLVTGVDRLAVPVLSPDETRVAFLRLPGRKHSTTPDQTEAEPFSISVVDLGSGAIRNLWSTHGPAVTLGMDDDEGALRWASDDTLVFYSEDDNWGRLYALPASGGTPRALTPANCMVAESEARKAQLLVIHNCADLDTRQMSMIDVSSGASKPVPEPDPVLAGAAIGGSYAAFVGATADHAQIGRAHV